MLEKHSPVLNNVIAVNDFPCTSKLAVFPRGMVSDEQLSATFSKRFTCCFAESKTEPCAVKTKIKYS